MLTAHQKALAINLADTQYGTFAEIGAGQEVARWFFRAGGAAGSIAETISAYDKTVSDARYGPAKRYVSRERLHAMLDHEFGALVRKLGPARGERTSFFVFADTVATRSYSRPGEGEGWLGMRFQTRPGAEPSEIVLHARLLDRETAHQQEALGVLGVNLVHGAFHHYGEPEAFIGSLLDGLTTERIEIDVVTFSGAAFARLDNRLISLQLVERGLTDAAMFTARGEMVQPSEVLHKRPILVERGRFRPITNLGFDILERAREQFCDDPAVRGEDPVVLMEMTLRDLATESTPCEHADFLARADTLCSLGASVLVSNFGRYFRLADYLSQHTAKPIAMAFGLPTLREVLDGRYYTDLPGGVLESFGHLFRNNVTIYVYPQRDAGTGKILTLDDLQTEPVTRHLKAFLVESGRLVPIHRFSERHLDVRAEEVRAKIAAGDPAWEHLVPPEVARTIKRDGLFGYRAAGPTTPPARAARAGPDAGKE